MKRIFSIITAISLGCLLSLGYIFIFEKNNNADAEGQYKVEYSSDIQSTLEKVTFKDKVKKLENLPFDVKGSYADLLEFSDELHQYEVTYISEDSKKYVTMRINNAVTVPKSEEYVIYDVQLRDGKEAKYLDNGVVEILYWEQDGLSYSLVYGDEERSKNKLNSNDINLDKFEDMYLSIN